MARKTRPNGPKHADASPASFRPDVVRARIVERMEALRDKHPERRISYQSLSLAAGLSRSMVYDFVVRKSIDNPRMDTLTKIAEVLDCSLEYLLRGKDNLSGSPAFATIRRMRIPIVGDVEAGVFTEMSGPEPWALSESEFDSVPAPQSDEYPSARHFGWRVHGDSMNNAKPPLLEGMIALCVDFEDAGLVPVTGRIYVVRRTTDGGQSYEWTIKRARVYRDRIELVPESTNPRHKILSFNPNDINDDSVVEIKFIGLVYGDFTPR